MDGCGINHTAEMTLKGCLQFWDPSQGTLPVRRHFQHWDGDGLSPGALGTVPATAVLLRVSRTSQYTLHHLCMKTRTAGEEREDINLVPFPTLAG